MGGPNSKPSVKEEYLKLIARQKQLYAQQHPTVYTSPRLLDWRVDVYQELHEAGRLVPWAFWPNALQSLLENWDILQDERWKSSLLWYDYLSTCNFPANQVNTTTLSTLAVPLPVSTSTETSNFLTFLKTHLEDCKNNAISAMIDSFAREFRQFYALNPADEQPFELAIDIKSEGDVKKVVKEVLLFVNICLNAFMTYYKGVELPVLLVSIAEIRDLIVERMFSYEVNETLQAILEVAEEEKQRVVDWKVEKYGDLRCEDLGIEPLFCLDRTRADGSGSRGYDKVISCLRSLTVARSPMAKLMIVVKSTRLVCECIDDYWAIDPSINKDQLVVNADQILSIYFYLILKAKIRNLSAHIRIMLEFLRKEIKQSTMGYYLSTIEASLENVARLDEAFLAALKSHNV